jgi:hypothetical protein
MPEFSVQQVVREREPFGDYEYEVRREGVLVARFFHDYRGDGCWVVFPDGRGEEVGAGVPNFLEGGGGQPLRLTDTAVRFLTARLPAGD